MTPADDPVDGDEIPRSARRLVGVVLGLLLVPGIVGFDLWPLTGWRLYSVSWTDTREGWAVLAEDAAGRLSTVSLEELPLGYRHAEWRMAGLPEASEARRREMCEALATAVVGVRPDTVVVRLAQDSKRLVRVDSEWLVTHDQEVVASCAVG